MSEIINGRDPKTVLLEDLSGTLKSLEKTIKILNEKNSFLAKVVVVLACFSFFASCIQIYLIAWPPSRAISHIQPVQNSQKQEVKLKSNLPIKTKASKSILTKPNNLNSSESKLSKKGVSEKELNPPSVSPK